MNKPLLHILHVDDDEEDRFIFRECLLEHDKDINLVQLDDGLALLQYLSALDHPDALPQIIVSDMKMPLTDGTEVLKAVSKHPLWQRIPVIILSTSSTDYDRNLTMHLGAAAFFSKPGSFSEAIHLVREIIQFGVNKETA